MATDLFTVRVQSCSILSFVYRYRTKNKKRLVETYKTEMRFTDVSAPATMRTK
jgi:hypothetical protein